MNVRRLVLLALPLALLTPACNKTSMSTNSDPRSASNAAATPDEFADARATFVKNCHAATRTDEVANERYEDEVKGPDSGVLSMIKALLARLETLNLKPETNVHVHP